MKRKYNYFKVIQQYYSESYGWEDVSFYETDSTFYQPKNERELLTHDLKEYRLTGYPTRVIRRREKKQD
jgi:hypothetical protein